MKPTKAEFQRFVEVQEGGRWNMLAPQAQAATGLDSDTYVYILNNYSELAKEYGDV